MSYSKNVQRVRQIDRGDVITSDYLNHVGNAVNRNTAALSGPKQQYALEQSETGGTAAPGGGGLTDLAFTEISRTNTTVTITDDGGNEHEIDQIDTVTFSNSNGDVLTLTFVNP